MPRSTGDCNTRPRGAHLAVGAEVPSAVGITALFGTLARLRGKLIDWRTDLIFGSHSIYVSRPDAVADLIRQAAAVTTG